MALCRVSSWAAVIARLLVITLVPDAAAWVTLPRSASAPAPSWSAHRITLFVPPPVVTTLPAVPLPKMMSSPAWNVSVAPVAEVNVTVALLLINKSSPMPVLSPAR